MMERRSAFCRPVVVRLHALFHRPPPPPPPPSPLDSHNSVGSLGRREREREREDLCVWPREGMYKYARRGAYNKLWQINL